jgi:hypothetical protein
VTVDLAQPGQVIWHLDVEWIAARHEYWALYNTYAPGGTCTTGALYLATSTDGIHWNTFPSPVAARGVIPAFADIIYRSTFSVDDADGTVTFWISGADFTTGRGYVWRTAVITRPIAEVLGQVASRLDLHLPEARPGLPPPEPDGLGN